MSTIADTAAINSTLPVYPTAGGLMLDLVREIEAELVREVDEAWEIHHTLPSDFTNQRIEDLRTAIKRAEAEGIIGFSEYNAALIAQSGQAA